MRKHEGVRYTNDRHQTTEHKDYIIIMGNRVLTRHRQKHRATWRPQVENPGASNRAPGNIPPPRVDSRCPQNNSPGGQWSRGLGAVQAGESKVVPAKREMELAELRAAATEESAYLKARTRPESETELMQSGWSQQSRRRGQQSRRRSPGRSWKPGADDIELQAGLEACELQKALGRLRNRA